MWCQPVPPIRQAIDHDPSPIDRKSSLIALGTVLTSNMDGMAAAEEAGGARP